MIFKKKILHHPFNGTIPQMQSLFFWFIQVYLTQHTCAYLRNVLFDLPGPTPIEKTDCVFSRSHQQPRGHAPQLHCWECSMLADLLEVCAASHSCREHSSHAYPEDAAPVQSSWPLAPAIFPPFCPQWSSNLGEKGRAIDVSFIAAHPTDTLMGCEFLH